MTRSDNGASGDGDVSASQVIEKTMSLSAVEFESSLAVFLGRTIRPGTTRADVDLDVGRVAITYQPVSGVTLGGLLALPRAIVRLTFEGVSEAERADFVRRFDIAFQRGGG